MHSVHFLVVAIIASLVNGGHLPKSYIRGKYLENPAIQRFRRYVQIDTSKEENLEYAVKFFREQATELGLSFSVYRPAGKPICVISWPGTKPELPSIMLNSHMDVVTVEEEYWTYPPFSAHLDDNGDIWGRGTQDDKDVSIQYLEAIRKLKLNNETLERTLHVTLMPDEESGGFQGMSEFIQTEEFKAMKVGVMLDEGIGLPDSNLYALYVDKRPWQMKITVEGASGHSSAFLGEVAIVKLENVLNEIEKHRQEQLNIKKIKSATDFGSYDSVNVNMIQGGYAPNVVPSKMSLVVDVRLAVDRTVEDMQRLLDSWVAVGGNGTTVEFLRRNDVHTPTTLESNIYWDALQDTINELGYVIEPAVCPATSDASKIRNIGITAIGFSPKHYTESRMHANNEYLNVEVFLRGIDIYVAILKKLGNLADC